MKRSNIYNILLMNTPLHLYLLIIAVIFLMLIQINAGARSVDFCQYYSGARNFFEGKSLYMPVSTKFCMDQLPRIRTQYNAYPPTTTLFFLPFGLLTLLTATILWSLLSLGFYLAALVILLSLLGWLSVRNMLLFVLMTLSWFHFYNALTAHNVSQLLLLLLTITWLLKKTHHLTLAGVVLGCVSLLKIWPVMLLIGFFLIGQKKIALAGCVTIAIGFFCALLLFGPSSFTTYYHNAPRENMWLLYPGNISLVGLSAKFFTSHARETIPIIKTLSNALAIKLGYIASAAVALGVFIFIYIFNKQTKNHLQELLIEGLLLSIALLTFPLTWDLNIIILLLPCAVIIMEYRKHFDASKRQILILMVIMALLLNPLPILLCYAYFNKAFTLNLSWRYCLLSFNLILLALGQVFLGLRIKKKLLTVNSNAAGISQTNI